MHALWRKRRNYNIQSINVTYDSQSQLHITSGLAFWKRRVGYRCQLRYKYANNLIRSIP